MPVLPFLGQDREQEDVMDELDESIGKPPDDKDPLSNGQERMFLEVPSPKILTPEASFLTHTLLPSTENDAIKTTLLVEDTHAANTSHIPEVDLDVEVSTFQTKTQPLTERRDDKNNKPSGTFVIPPDTASLLARQERSLLESYAEQLAAILRLKTSELSWLFIEAEGRLALSREWTEEAKAAGESEWTRYQKDIEILEAALNDAWSMLDHACEYE
jgi:hypothetical protein